MTKIKDIYGLIRSLTEVEISQFRLYAASARDGISPNIVGLFEALVEEIKTKSGHYERIQVLPEVKSTLYQHLLRFLRYFHDEQNITLQIGNRVREAQVMYDKCLYDQADALITEAKQLATHFEQFYDHLQILNLEKRQLQRMPYLESQSARLRIEEEERDVLFKLENYIKYRNCSKEISEVYRLPERTSKSTKLDQLSQIFSSNLLNDESQAASLTALYYFLHERSSYFYYLGDIHKAWESNNRLLELIKSKPFLIDLSVEGFVVTFFNNLVFNLELEHYSEFEVRLREFRRIPQSMRKYDSFQFRKMIFERAEFLEFKKLLCLGKFEEGLELVPDIYNEMEAYGQLMDVYYRAQFYFMFAYFCFIVERFAQAKNWVDRILEIENLREDIRVNGLLLKHILEFELQDEETFTRTLPATLHFLQESKRMMSTETLLLETLEKVFSAKKKLAIRNEFNRLKDELEDLRLNPFERKNLSSFDYLAWVDSKIGPETFRDVFVRRDQTHKFRVIR